MAIRPIIAALLPALTLPAAAQDSAPTEQQTQVGQASAPAGGLARMPAPQYPVSRSGHHREGTVVIMVAVSPDGKAESARIVESSRDRRFDNAALKALQKEKYPAKGKHVLYRVAARLIDQ